MTTVIADDSELARTMLQKMMQRIDPFGRHYAVDSAAKAIELLLETSVDVLFLDIEMPGIDGIEAAHYIETMHQGVNIVLVTGHPEYARDALRVYCSGFIEKPFDEDDVRDALKHLRYPVEQSVSLVVQCRDGFAVLLNGEPFSFKRKLTCELFAYLVYKNGAMCTNGELIGILWDGNPDKAVFLRQLVKDMRDSFKNAGISDIVVKRHGSIGLNPKAYTVDGDVSMLEDEFHWF